VELECCNYRTRRRKLTDTSLCGLKPRTGISHFPTASFASLFCDRNRGVPDDDHVKAFLHTVQHGGANANIFREAADKNPPNALAPQLLRQLRIMSSIFICCLLRYRVYSSMSCGVWPLWIMIEGRLRRPSADATMRCALVASTVCTWIWFMMNVSTSCASGSGVDHKPAGNFSAAADAERTD